MAIRRAEGAPCDRVFGTDRDNGRCRPFGVSGSDPTERYDTERAATACRPEQSRRRIDRYSRAFWSLPITHHDRYCASAKSISRTIWLNASSSICRARRS